MQHKAMSDAASRQRELATQSQMRQMAAQEQATKVASQTAEQYDPATRKKAQDAIQGELNDKYTQAAAQPALTAQGVQVGATIPQESGGADYTAAQAREAAKTAASMHALAGFMSRTGAPDLLRQREGVAFGDAAGAIGRIGSGAANTAKIDEMGIKSVVPDGALTIGGQALQAFGVSHLAAAGLGGSGGSNYSLGTGESSVGLRPTLSEGGIGMFGPSNGGLGMTTTGRGLGLTARPFV